MGKVKGNTSLLFSAQSIVSVVNRAHWENISMEFSVVEKAALQLIRNDLRFAYSTIHIRNGKIDGNYTVNFLPYMGLITDGIEDWISAYNNTHKTVQIPLTFTEEERIFYEQMRSAIKIWNNPYDVIYNKIYDLYNKSNNYFSSIFATVNSHGYNSL